MNGKKYILDTNAIIDLLHGNNDLLLKINTVVELRKIYRIKLPDCIIGVTTIISDAILITRDKQLSKITSLNIEDAF